ncbi:MAG: T9SS type A sorting domain-containing protein [Chitinophagales bacterium]|jgi:hypothetical protein|nr:T9SS type A sorting domain-containing protein [Bacteroidota bacterium]MBK7567847.1 T9SS type A sorting domain-containing protein [Bacteroidota bacterium]MBP8915916.1 T9SS type A sorting domain-containing protein [Chitinophagales bacterium]MBP9220235.1 T9SS type A sorting domain-containing protein [Chitinophagales bacterium]MBP9794664.1 T9SS type A sorting domain-containing protein [Chitinophagales bacterium]
MKIFNVSKRMAIATLSLLLASATAFGQYCTPTYTTGTVEGDYCGYVGLGTIDNPTDGAPAPFYSDYTFMSTDVALGSSYTVTVGSGSYTSNNDIAIWIDYNHDEDFYDADELVGTVVDLGAFATGTATFSIPVTAIGGPTRMRVREIFNMPTTPDACASYSFGETEDYSVNIIGGALNDVGVVDITNPVSGVDLGFEDVIVTIYNYGSEPASEFNVYYQVDGGIVTGGAFLGTIEPYSTASYTMPEGWDFSLDGCYDIVSWTEMEIDENTDNDSYTETVCNLGPITGTGAMYIYSNSTGGEPWFQVTNTTAMNTVFGAEGIGWTRDYYETVDPLLAFSPDNCFIFLEGSDTHADELEAFLSANIGTIESWVTSGGKLLLNSAPNEGDGMSFGFDGTSLIYDGGASAVTAADASHPIFNGPILPVGTDFTGGNFSHARVEGTDITSVIIETGTTDITLGEKAWGDGLVMFGGMTTNNFHSPILEAANLRANILAYLSCITFAVCEIPGGLYADGITTNDAVLHWDAVDGADQYRVTLQNLATGLIKTKGFYTNMVEITDKLTPLTEYGFRVKTVCYDDLGVISAPSPWYYFMTLGRIGENEDASVMLYPNPSNGVFNLNVNGYADNQFELNVSNSMGQIVYTKSITVNNADYNEQINLMNVAPGMYQISLKNNDLNLNYSVVIVE